MKIPYDPIDVLVITKLDRLARSRCRSYENIQALERKGAGLRVLNLRMDTSTPTGKLMLTVLGGIAQFEREMMMERQRESVIKEGRGKIQGTKINAEAIKQEVICLAEEGTTKAAIASRLKIGEATVYRILAGASKQKQNYQAKPSRPTCGHQSGSLGFLPALFS